jgi:hypothetical protein
MNTKNFKFNLMGDEWQVEFVDVLEDTDNKDELIYGRCFFDSQTIMIAKKSANGKEFSNRVLQRTLLHEMTHAIFGEGCYTASNNDEPLVEWTARCLQDILKVADKLKL